MFTIIMFSNYLTITSVPFVCVSLKCILFIVLRYLCLYDVLFMLLVIWLLTQQINEQWN